MGLGIRQDEPISEGRVSQGEQKMEFLTRM